MSILDSAIQTIKNPLSSTVNGGGERPQDFPNGFFIREYQNGEQVNETLFLLGNLMPFQPFEWSGEQRLVKEYYPGNPEASVQVMGAKEGPLPIKGRFKDKKYDAKQIQYGTAYQYNLAINEIRKRGNLIKFGMNGDAGSWVRWGFLERGSFKMNKLSWIDYDIEFFVVSETQPINNYFSADEKQAPSAVNQNMINAASNFQANYSAVPKSMPQSIAGAINNLISAIATPINLVTNFVGTVISTAQSIEDSANRALGLIKNARAQLSVFRRQIDNLTHGFNSLSTQGNPAGQTRDTYSNIQYIVETNAATRQLSLYLAQMQAQFEAISQTIPIARYKVQVGDTLQNISIRFYGISDHWSDIYDHNQLQSTALTPGAILEIPHL